MVFLRHFVGLCLLTTTEILGYRSIKHDGDDLILANAGEAIDIVCQNEVPLVRCGFTHPNGTKILFVNVVAGTPSCKFTTNATSSEIGLWTCHLWTPQSPQHEIIKTVEVRVVDKFAALDKEVRVKEGDRTMLSCVSSEGMLPLNECYFMAPGQWKIHMDDLITEELLVQNKYFFPQNHSVHRGDCSITILAVDVTDSGLWTCSGWLELENREYADTIQLEVYSSASTNDAADDKPKVIRVTAYVCSTLAILFVFVAVVWWKERHSAYTLFYGKRWSDEESVDSYGVDTGSSQILVRETK